MKKIPKIIDNNRRQLLDTLISASKGFDEISIATGYWDLEATALLLPYIKKYKKIRLLIGREPLIPRNQLSPNQIEPDFPDKDIFDDLQRLKIDSNLRPTVKELKNLATDKILEVKVFKKAFLHAKCYIFGNLESEDAIGIIGSSNFTKNGLTKNRELNTGEDDQRIVQFNPKNQSQEHGHLSWFEEVWADEGCVEWTGKFIELVDTSVHGEILFSPYEMYIKTLFELYKDELEETDIQTSIASRHELFEFQKKNVQALLRRLKKHRTAMLSDSVGLGKTYTAIEVIKQYLDSEEGRQRVVVICPKSLKEQWATDLAIQGVLNLKPIVFQNKDAIAREQDLDHIASVSLFVVDESHNLRKTSGKRYGQLLEWMRNNPKAHVLMLTATPINNQLTDIANQVLLGTRGQSDILQIPSVNSDTKQTTLIDFHQAIENLRKRINQDRAKGKEPDYEYIRQTMAPIIRHFVVRRTRHGIEKEYGGTLLINGKEMRFPNARPENQKYKFNPGTLEQILAVTSKEIPLETIYKANPQSITNDCRNLKHPLDQMDKISSWRTEKEIAEESPMYFIFQLVLMLGLVPYRWRIYQTKFYGKTPEEIHSLRLNSDESKSLQLQISMYGILRTIFLKRMESSISAVRTSVETYRRKLDVFEKGLTSNKIVSLKDFEALEEMLADDDEDIEQPQEEINLEAHTLDEIDENSYCVSAIKEDVKKEKLLLGILLEFLRILESDDSKLRSFSSLLENLHKENKAGGKVLIFSYFADTINYLRDNIKKYTPLITDENTAFVSSANRSSAELLASRFSPHAKNYSLKKDEKELHYLFSTDVLSEGQNLQDCGVVVNYDLHWNPVRMIQRNGRVNRLGSPHKTVYVYNMSPEAKLESYLRLVERLEGKIGLINYTIGLDQAVLDEIPNPIDFTDNIDDIYSKDEQVRIRALTKLETAADFLLSEDEYIFDLKRFHLNTEHSEQYKRSIYSIPRGKWGIMPKRQHAGSERPPVLACAKLYFATEPIGLQFGCLDREATRLEAVATLQALEWLRTSSEDTARTSDKISCDRVRMIEKIGKDIATYQSQDEAAAPAPQQLDLLRLMSEQQYAIEDINAVRASFSTRNVIDKQKITQLVRNIARAKRNGKPYLEDLNEVLALARRTASPERKPIRPDAVETLLFYAKDNK